MTQTYRVRVSDTIKADLIGHHDTAGLPWRAIADLPEYTPMPAGTLCAIARGYPVPKKWRKHLGLPDQATIIQINGSIPFGSQAIGAHYCIKCQRPYISNHPRRRKCFICSPFRGRKP